MTGREAEVRAGWVVAYPPRVRPCMHCGSRDRPLRFRGWVRLSALIVGKHERRTGGYACPACSRRESAVALLHTALLGWWSFPSLFYFAPRATLWNWRSLFAPPASPGDWGADALEAPSHYALLGVAPHAHADQIRAAYRARAKQLHPDTGGGEAAHAEMARLNRAWEVLGSPERRQAYDAER